MDAAQSTKTKKENGVKRPAVVRSLLEAFELEAPPTKKANKEKKNKASPGEKAKEKKTGPP